MTKFEPISTFTIPHLILSVDNWEEKYEKFYDYYIQCPMQFSPTTTNVVTDFYNENRVTELVDKCNFFYENLSEEIDKISRAFFEWCKFSSHEEADREYCDEYDKFVIDSAWFEHANAFNWHPPHDHGTTELACVLYMNYDPMLHQPLHIVSPFQSFDSNAKTFVPQNVKSGDIVCFPGNLLHYTTPNNSAVPRLVAAWNMKRKSTLMDQEFLLNVIKNQ